jgi:carboxylesterase type B
LWLNVFTRDLVMKKKRPVVVWIHGGNFVRGSAGEYEPDYILDEDDIVLVTIQYRLGMFGFLSTEDENAPGNYGMLDQVWKIFEIRHQNNQSQLRTYLKGFRFLVNCVT